MNRETLDAGFLLVIGACALAVAALWFARKTVRPADEVLWYKIGHFFGALWILCVGIVLVAPSAPVILWATRFAWPTSAVAEAAAFLFVRRLLTGRPVESKVIFTIFSVALATGAPAVMGASVVEFVELSAGLPIFHYGSWVIVAASFHIVLIFYQVVFSWRVWPGVEWEARNRLFILLLSIIPWIAFTAVINTVVILVTNEPYYAIAPVLAVVPMGVALWTLHEQQLPDFFAALGRVIPTSKRRFLDTLSDFENKVDQINSVEAALDRLSGIFGARVAFSPAGTAGAISGERAPVSLWIPPEGRGRLYGRRDLSRIRRLIDHIDKLRPEAVEEAARFQITGWSTDAQIPDPKPSPWIVGSAASYRAAERVRAILESEPGVIIEVDEGGEDLARGIAAASRRLLAEVDYPDQMDGGLGLARELTEEQRMPQSLLLLVRVETDYRAPIFEDAIRTLMERGAKVVIVARIGLARMAEREMFRDGRFALLEIPMLVAPNRFRRPEDLSALVDHYVAEIETSYGRRFSMTPEEREALCSEPWPGSAELLRSLLERMILYRWNADPLGTKFLA